MFITSCLVCNLFI